MFSVNSDDFGRFMLSLQAYDSGHGIWYWYAMSIGTFALTILLGLAVSSLTKRFFQDRHSELQKLMLAIIFPLTINILLAAAISVVKRFGMDVTLLVVFLDVLSAYLTTSLVIHCLATVVSSRFIRKCCTYYATFLIWGLTLVHLFGLEKETFDNLDRININLGKQKITLNTMIEVCSMSFLAILGALFLWKVIERRISRITGIDPGLLLAINRVGKLVFITLFLMIALPYAGFDLTNVTVFFGAFAVGLGFGFQRIASSYVAGLILLFEQSVRLGDYVTINDFVGMVETMTGRFTVVRASDGNAIMIPNESVVSASVVNSSKHHGAIKFIRKTVKITVPYCLNIHDMMEKLQVIPLQNAGVTAEIAPAVSISDLTNLGVVLDISFSIIDPAASGGGSIVNNLYKTIFDELKKSGSLASFQAQPLHNIFHA